MLIGLTFRPFFAIREVTRRPILFPTIFSPFLGLLVLFIVGRVAAFLVTVYGVERELIAMILSMALISIFFWQVLLIYLLVSFLVAFWGR